MASKSTAHWICQVCHNAIEQAGVVEVINANIDLAPIGAYPVRASENEHEVQERYLNELAVKKGVDRSELNVFRLDEVSNTPEAIVNIAFVARHVDCIRDRELQGYVIGTSRAASLENWVGWVIHLHEKNWMGGDDHLRMLAFWWTHKGEEPPTGM